jgi:hypothetical protein
VYRTLLELLTINILKNLGNIIRIYSKYSNIYLYIVNVFPIVKLVKKTNVRNGYSIDLIIKELIISLNITLFKNSSCIDFVNLIKDNTIFLNTTKDQKNANGKITYNL